VKKGETVLSLKRSAAWGGMLKGGGGMGLSSEVWIANGGIGGSLQQCRRSKESALKESPATT